MKKEKQISHRTLDRVAKVVLDEHPNIVCEDVSSIDSRFSYLNVADYKFHQYAVEGSSDSMSDPKVLLNYRVLSHGLLSDQLIFKPSDYPEVEFLLADHVKSDQTINVDVEVSLTTLFNHLSELVVCRTADGDKTYETSGEPDQTAIRYIEIDDVRFKDDFIRLFKPNVSDETIQAALIKVLHLADRYQQVIRKICKVTPIFKLDQYHYHIPR